jgi:iron uptake system component EfeO
MKLSTLSPLALAVSTALLLAACGEQAAKPAATPAASGAAAAPAAGGEVQVSVNDKVCEPMELTVPAGKTTFVIKNNSMKALEWEILKGVMIVDERENIAPSLTQKLTVTLQPGEYEITCGLLSNPRGKLIVTENAGFKADAKTTEIAALAEPLGAYKTYVQEEMKQLVAKTEAFTAAVKAGDDEKAKSLYADTRTHYERIEPIAELFAELDASIDARADAFETLEKDPNFTGFHRLEYALWSQKNIKDMGATADKLLADVKLLQTEIDNLASLQAKW